MMKLGTAGVGRMIVFLLLFGLTGAFLKTFGQQNEEKVLLTNHFQVVRSFHDIPVTIRVEQASLPQIFRLLEEQTGLRFLYNQEVIGQSAHRLDLDFPKASAADVLVEVGTQTGLDFRQINRIIAVGVDGFREPVPGGTETEQPETVHGSVIDSETREALPGVNILLKGTTTGTSTGPEGRFTLNVSGVADTLIVTYIGYQRAEIPVGERDEVLIELIPEILTGEEIVVVGYGQQRRATLTGSIATMPTRELVQSPVSNISNSLAGRLPGLIAVQRSGEPGFDSSVLRIRGISTLTSGSAANPLILVDGIERESLNLLDPHEIESISILKDASSTAVFGVRGANGVILITTKSGTPGRPQISYSSNTGFQSVNSLPQMLNSYEYAMLRNEASINSGQTPFYSERSLELFRTGEDPIFHPDTDWFDLILRDYSMQQHHNLNIGGGSENVRYFISLGYFDQEGAYDVQEIRGEYSANPKYQRYNLRSNFDIDFNEDLSASVRLGAQFTDSNYPGTSAAEIFFRILNSNPTMNPGIVDGRLINSVEGLVQSSGSPLSHIVNTGYQRNFASTLNTSVRLVHKLDFITTGLLARGQIAYDNYYQHVVRRNKGTVAYRIVRHPDNPNEPVFIPQGDEGPFSFSEEYERNRKIYVDLALEYANSFGPHNITALALYNQEEYIEPELEFNIPRAYQGLVGRLTYDYDMRYLFEFNVGYNGSENFPDHNRYGFFPSLSLGWVPTQESFFPENNFLTFLKIRGSYGEVGNDRIGGDRFLYLPSVFHPGRGGYNFGRIGDGSYQWYSGTQEGRIGNPNVTWERARKANIGIETGFFSDRLSITADLFTETRESILTSRGTIPDLVQAALPRVNIGGVDNRGYEFEVEWRDQFGPLDYWMKGSYTYAKNTIRYMDEPLREYPWLQRTGHSVDQFWGLQSDGFYNTEAELAEAPRSAFTDQLQLGDIRYIDQNGDGIIDHNDEVPIGYSPLPRIIYGFSIGGAYKGFDFSVLFQGAAQVSAYIDQMGAWAFDTDWRSATTRHLERWTPERYGAGEKITYPRVELSPTSSMHNYRPSDFWLEDASYLRLKNAEIAYNFQPGFLNVLGVQNLRIYANGNNLITWSKMKTNFDPEAPSGRGQFYPQMRVYNFGVNIQF